MIGLQIKNVFLDFAKTDFRCPNCNAKYSDADNKYSKRCNENKSWTTKINCKCGRPFFMTYNYMGDAVSFV
jgi:hypothetical protein